MCVRNRFVFDCGHPSVETEWRECNVFGSHHHWTTYTDYVSLCASCQHHQNSHQLVRADDNDSTFTGHSGSSGNSYHTAGYGHGHHNNGHLYVHINVRRGRSHRPAASHVRVRYRG